MSSQSIFKVGHDTTFRIFYVYVGALRLHLHQQLIVDFGSSIKLIVINSLIVLVLLEPHILLNLFQTES
jgi:hypothetical protein